MISGGPHQQFFQVVLTNRTFRIELVYVFYYNYSRIGFKIEDLFYSFRQVVMPTGKSHTESVPLSELAIQHDDLTQ